MRRYETLETLLGKVDLSFVEAVLSESYHVIGSRGRPPRSPLGVFKAHLLRRFRHVPSDRMLVRQLWKDPRLRRLCDIEDREPPYGIAVLSRFKRKVGPERFNFHRVRNPELEPKSKKRAKMGSRRHVSNTLK